MYRVVLALGLVPVMPAIQLPGSRLLDGGTMSWGALSQLQGEYALPHGFTMWPRVLAATYDVHWSHAYHLHPCLRVLTTRHACDEGGRACS